jgi:hypothetical protein
MTVNTSRHILCSKETEIELIKQSIENIEEKVNDIHRHLVGNGRPGLLERVGNIEISQKVIYAIISLLIAGITIVVSIFIK